MRVKDALGRFGEETAVRHLRDDGFEIIERNWRCRSGEVDIIARDRHCLVFCEVKTRSSGAYGLPVEAVNAAKVARLRRVAAAWLDENTHEPATVRFDVVSVRRGRDSVRIEHLRGAF